MPGQTQLTGHCEHCGADLRFPAQNAGLSMACPYCGERTELLPVFPKERSSLPVKTVVYTILAVLILVGGLIGVLIALKRAERALGTQNPPPAAAPANTQ